MRSRSGIGVDPMESSVSLSGLISETTLRRFGSHRRCCSREPVFQEPSDQLIFPKGTI